MSKKSLILGYGVSGHGAEKLLLSRKKDFAIWEDNAKQGITNPPLNSITLDQFDEIIVSPGIPPNHSVIVKAIGERIPILTELDLALPSYRKTIIAITGTNGKSTVTAMIYHGLKELGHSVLMAGNIGTPLAEYLAHGDEADFIVLELSSYQLHYLHRHLIDCAVFTNFSADHDSWHGSYSAYFKDKWKLFGLVKKAGKIIVGKSVLAKSQELKYALPADIPIDSVDSTSNLEFAIRAISFVTKRSAEEVKVALNTFKGLPHRIEYVGSCQKHPVWNDSKATNLESTLFAIKNIGLQPFVLMLGGRLKNGDFASLLGLDAKYKQNITHIYSFGESHKKIELALSNQYSVTSFESLSGLLDQLIPTLKQSPQTILFSPGGSSFDEFRSFVERGDFFRARISEILDEKTSP